jgi:hypothetical protein
MLRNFLYVFVIDFDPPRALSLDLEPGSKMVLDRLLFIVGQRTYGHRQRIASDLLSQPSARGWFDAVVGKLPVAAC